MSSDAEKVVALDLQIVDDLLAQKPEADGYAVVWPMLAKHGMDLRLKVLVDAFVTRDVRPPEFTRQLVMGCMARLIADRLSPATTRKLAAFEKIRELVVQGTWTNFCSDVEKIVAEAERSE